MRLVLECFGCTNEKSGDDFRKMGHMDRLGMRRAVGRSVIKGFIGRASLVLHFNPRTSSRRQ